jgi:1,2-beta-oligoglucan phosphorylase
VDAALAAVAPLQSTGVPMAEPVRSLVQQAPPLAVEDLDADAIARLWPERRHEERDAAGAPLSFFVPDAALNRHVVLRAKERMVRRRHGALLRSGASLLPDDDALCATMWAHGVFAAQLTLGNTSLHKLFSVSRDPYNITRGSGLRILVDAGEGWRLLTVPSAFELGLAECRWIYCWPGRRVTVRAAVSGQDAAMQWQVTVDRGAACRFLLVGHLVLGEREWEQAATVEIDAAARRVAFRPEPDSPWGRQYPDAAVHLVTSTPDAVEAIGGDELLCPGRETGRSAVIALRTRVATGFAFAVTGSLADPARAAALADRYAAGVPPRDLLAPAVRHWTEVTRGLRIRAAGGAVLSPAAAALDTAFPWLVHDALMHLTVPHGLEQYTGAAWGTRDVCQGPIELLLALEHDDAAKAILRILFAEQGEARGDWPQWFMLEPYAAIRDPDAHGDVIIWPLKALCDYVEATGDLAILEEPVPWRREADSGRTTRQDPIATHVETLLATVRGRFVPGTHLPRYGNGDWNDALQPVDPLLRERMVSGWTAALLLQQLGRYAGIYERVGHADAARALRVLADAMRADFDRHLVRDGVVAGYAIFPADGLAPELLLHPSDRRTGVRYSLLPMTRALIAGLFDEPTARRHVALIREHLVFPDGARLMDRPIAYHGGTMQLFRRAESAAYFGREIGLMYTHAHLRYAEAMAASGDAEALWRALLLVNPIAVTDLVPHAALRQRNASFSSSDAAFADRYAASRDWEQVRRGTVAVEGGWRIYSSGPGIYISLLVRHVFGHRRWFGQPVHAPLLPPAEAGAGLALTPAARPQGHSRA